jgi:hypothetical protein
MAASDYAHGNPEVFPCPQGGVHRWGTAPALPGFPLVLEPDFLVGGADLVLSFFKWPLVVFWARADRPSLRRASSCLI